LRGPAGLQPQYLPHARVERHAACEQAINLALVEAAILDRVAESKGAASVFVDVQEVPIGRVADADDGDAILRLSEITHDRVLRVALQAR